MDYAVTEFGRQLRAALSGISGDLGALRKRQEQLEREIKRFADAIACGGTLDALVQQIATRERELKGITNKLLSSNSDSLEARLSEMRQFVKSGIADLRTMLNREPALAKRELHNHLSEIRMTPAQGKEDWHYVADGSWSLLGTGPNTPVLALAHSDGCGGPMHAE
jgi:ABC-type transporter Mla subunit MlaD